MRIDYPGGQWLEFTYDDAGRGPSSEDQLGHRLNYHYDAVGRLESMTDESGADIVDYSYDDATGRLARKTLGNGLYATYEYDPAGQLLHLANFTSDNSELSRFDCTYDNCGRRTSMTMLDESKWTHQYDDIGQLTHAVLDSNDPSVTIRISRTFTTPWAIASAR